MTKSEALATWSAPKLFVICWAVLTGAIGLKIILYAVAASAIGAEATPIGKGLMFTLPITGVGAWMLTNWIRSMVSDEYDRPQS